LLLEAMKLIGVHGKMSCARKPGAIGDEYRITIVIDVPERDRPTSARDRKRNHERTRR
jgi:hypothetical protein